MEFAYKLRQAKGMSTNAERFGRIVKERRTELDYTQLDVWAAGGPSNTTLTKIENGQLEDLERKTAQKLDEALRWLPKSARTAWEGGDPTPLPEGVRTQDGEFVRDLIEKADLPPATKEALLAVLDSSVA